ncbi:MAG: nucleoside deaminase [Bacteroidales bacterium]|nr:nucleoside deaminase [Bacteroidales bacterium]
MQIAINEAKKAFENDEVPVGAIVVLNNQVIAKAYNQTEILNDPTAHAEMLAITSANQFLGSKYLTDARLYVTLEPCIMCSGAIFWSKISALIYGASDIKNGFMKIENNLNQNITLSHPKLIIKGGVLEEEASILMKDFFKKKRKF